MEAFPPGFLDLYGILGLNYGVSIDTIRDTIKNHHKSGKITPQLGRIYNEILEVISVPERKDMYDTESTGPKNRKTHNQGWPI